MVIGKRLFGITPLRLCHHSALVSSLLRRLFLPSVSGIWDALTGGNSASIAVRRGMQLFRQGDVHGSLVEFDKAIESDPRQKPYLWQRELSLYHLDRFEEGAEQFRLEVAVNPNDTEESIWCFLCDAQLYRVDEVRKRFLEVSRDPRHVMREAYSMFKDGGDPAKFVSEFFNGQRNDIFMRLYMLGCITNLRGFGVPEELSSWGRTRHVVAGSRASMQFQRKQYLRYQFKQDASPTLPKYYYPVVTATSPYYSGAEYGSTAAGHLLRGTPGKKDRSNPPTRVLAIFFEIAFSGERYRLQPIPAVYHQTGMQLTYKILSAAKSDP